MKSPARARAETLFASITSREDSTIEPPATPSETAPRPHPAGPNTLHLPAGTPPALSGRTATRSRRLQAPAIADKT